MAQKLNLEGMTDSSGIMQDFAMSNRPTSRNIR